MYIYLTNSKRILLKKNLIVKRAENLISANFNKVKRSRMQQSNNSTLDF